MNLHVLIEASTANPEELEVSLGKCRSLISQLDSEYKIADVIIRSNGSVDADKARIEGNPSYQITHINSRGIRFHQIRELIKSIPNSDVLVVLYCIGIELNATLSTELLAKAIKEGNAIGSKESLSIQVYSLRDLKMAYDQNYRPNYTDDIQVLQTFGFPINYVTP